MIYISLKLPLTHKAEIHYENFRNKFHVIVGIYCFLFNTLRPRQNGRHFANDIFKCIVLNENVWISIKISLRFVPKGPIINIPALFQIMAFGAVQATSHYLNQWWLIYRRIYVSLGLNDSNTLCPSMSSRDRNTIVWSFQDKMYQGHSNMLF